jgi:hypothetical protein
MTGWRNPKDPLDVPKSIRLRDRAGSLKAQADALLREADALLAEAEKIEAAEKTKRRTPRDDVNQAAARVVREATERS